MANMKNDALRKRLVVRYNQLVVERTVGDPSEAKVLADEFGISYQMICYYLRGGNRGSVTKDARRAYTIKELNNLELMSTEDKEAWAIYTGRSLRAVDAALARHRKSFKDYLTATKHAIPAALRDITERGYLNFASLPELKAVSMNREVVEEAKRGIKPFGLSLRSPNILFHKPTNRRLLMTTEQQVFILSDASKFLKTYSNYIKEHWTVGDVDPISDGYMDLEDRDHVANIQHRKTRNAAIDTGIRGKAKLLSDLLPDAIRYETLQLGLPTCDALTTLKIWLDRALAVATPADSFIDHVRAARNQPDLTDLNTVPDGQTCTTCARRVAADATTCPHCLSDKGIAKLVRIIEPVKEVSKLEETPDEDEDSKRSAHESDDDAWMKDWRPKSSE